MWSGGEGALGKASRLRDDVRPARFSWRAEHVFIRRMRSLLLGVVVYPFALVGGCSEIPAANPAPLFYLPLSIDGTEVEPAFVDTGGDFEVLLKESLHLTVVGETPVLAFSGLMNLPVTEGFEYVAGGVARTAPFAIVGLPTCPCNGLGVQFLRKCDAVLRLDFATNQATLESTLPEDGVVIEFEAPPNSLPGFFSSFVTVHVGEGFEPPLEGRGLPVLALFDTGARATVMKRRLFESTMSTESETADITIEHGGLGTVGARVVLYDGVSLPDMIVGTDVMRAWGDIWYFAFEGDGGRIVVVANVQEESSDGDSVTGR